MKYLKIALIAILLAGAVAGYFVIRDWAEGRSDRDARIIELETTLDSIKDEIEEDEAAFREQEEEWKKQRETDSTTIAGLTVEVVEAGADADRRVDELRRRLPIQFRAEFDELVTAHQRQVAAILSREREKDAIIARSDANHARAIADMQQINDNLHRALATSEDLSREWEEKSKRAIWEKTIFTIPVTIATTVLLTNALTSK